MDHLLQIFSYICVLVAAVIVGSWFLAEYQKARDAGKAWYAAYATVPGLLIIFFILMLPLAIYFLGP